MANARNLSSPNRMVWELFAALRRLCARVEEEQTAQDKPSLRQDAAISVILAVQCVEVFFNVYFRVLISEPSYDHASERILTDLENKSFGLDGKIKEWPLAVFGERLALNKGPGQRFIELKNLRHSLMHFKSTHETVAMPGVEINGLADTTIYESLSAKSATEALATAEAFMCEVFKLRGISSEQLPHALHSWTGKPPL